MYEAKTKPTTASVTAYLDAIEDATRRQDCQELVKLMTRVSGCKPKMWGPSIVGFDQYHYKYASGHEGDSCIIGFSSRKTDLTIYTVAGATGVEGLAAELGKHKASKSCLYVKRLEDIQLPVLEQLLTRAMAETRRMYPPVAEAKKRPAAGR
jgi:hypothetical protein